MIMNVRELNREQLKELKERYMIQLADAGEFAEVMGVDYDAPSYGDMANADELVPDEVVFRQWDGVYFVEEDFA
jgi:hypothetical protein